ncbi:MAG: ATP-grasp domain-containing protein [Hyphomicrobiaceae bacterium]|nr:ATP-grasp domain-containing protein [Hyphomicrobiaceae bacterium]
MSQPTVLIAAFAGRALAASVRRAGYVPLVADAFGDLDTARLAHSCEVIPDAMRRGFREQTLLPALERLSACAPRPPEGLVLGAGFEEHSKLVERLSHRFRILGCSASTIRETKDPTRFFTLLDKLGIAHPETRSKPPADARGWLTKRIGASGGVHIARCRASARIGAHRYAQREQAGALLSMTGIVSKKGAAFAFAQPWVSPMPRRPFRYGGLVGSIDLDADLEARLIEIGLDLSRHLELMGLVSFDLMVNEGVPNLLEVNPRPGASIDIFDDDDGTLFKAHIAAATGSDPTPVLTASWAPKPRAAAYLYADRADIEVPDIAWPQWTSDRPVPGTFVSRYTPLATVHATGASHEAAAVLVKERLGQLEALLYGHAKKNEETLDE